MRKPASEKKTKSKKAPTLFPLFLDKKEGVMVSTNQSKNTLTEVSCDDKDDTYEIKSAELTDMNSEEISSEPDQMMLPEGESSHATILDALDEEYVGIYPSPLALSTGASNERDNIYHLHEGMSDISPSSSSSSASGLYLELSDSSVEPLYPILINYPEFTASTNPAEKCVSEDCESEDPMDVYLNYLG